MQHYELMVLLHPDIADADLPAVLTQVKQVVTDTGATITKEEALGKRKLAYEINKLRQGIYHLVEFDGPGTAVPAIDQAFRLNKQVVRHMTVTAKVRTPEDIEREEALRAKIEAKRRAATAEATAAQIKADQPEVKPEPEAPAEVSRQEIDEKLESILDEDLMK